LGFKKMTTGERLKEERSLLGFSPTDMGAAGGVGKTTQSSYEERIGKPDAAYLAEVVDLGVDVLYVVTSECKPTPANSILTDEAQLLEHYRLQPVPAKATGDHVCF